MGKLHLRVGGTDLSAYLRRATVRPGGNGLVGAATFELDKQAGGIDVRSRQVVEFWEDYDGNGNGVADRGRFFGGLVQSRDMSTIGTTGQWSLSCDDFNLIGRALVRDMQAAKAVSLTAGTFKAQVIQLTQVVQRNGAGSVAVEIDADSAVQDLHPTMPAVTLEPGHTYFWYLGQLLAKAVELNSALKPTFFLGTGVTVGLSEVFGPPALYVYDRAAAALNPPAFYFSDVPAGSEKRLWELVRKTASNDVVQRQQGVAGVTVVTGFNSAAASAYPNPYINHGVNGNYGAWMDEPLSGANDQGTAGLQALLDRRTANLGYPRDSYGARVNERVRVGEYAAVDWAIYGIENLKLEVVDAEYTIEPPLDVWVSATLNARRLRFGEDPDADVYAPPVEGDNVPPLPPAGASLGAQSWDWARMRAALPLTITASPSPDVAGYLVQGYLGGEPVVEDVGMNLSPVLYWIAGLIFSIQVFAYDSSGNVSLIGAPDPTPISGTTMSAPAPPAPTGLAVTQAYQGDNTSIVRLTWTHSVQPLDYRDRYEVRRYADGEPTRATVVPVDRNSTSVDLEVPNHILYYYAIRTVGVGSVYGPWSSDVSLEAVPVDNNLLYNGSFEIPVKGAAGLPAGWSRVLVGGPGGGRGTGTTNTFDGVATYTGNNLTTANTVTLLSTRFTVVPGRVYAFGVARVGGPNSRLTFSVDWLDANGNKISNTALLSSITPPTYWLWAYTEHQATAPAGAVYARVVIDLAGSTGTGDAIVVDGVTVVETAGSTRLSSTGVAAGTYSLPKYTLGADGRVTASSSLAGTAFPGSPAANDVFYRTDLGVWCKYDGTRWLGPPQQVRFLKDNTAPTFAGTTYWAEADAPEAGTYWVERITWRGRVATTNNGSNYWTLRLGELNSGLGGTVMGDLPTSSKAAGVVWALSQTSFSGNPVNMGDGQEVVFFAEVRKDVGAPGNLTLYGCTAIVRRVYT